MDQYRVMGKSVVRKEALDQVTGRAHCMDDYHGAEVLHVNLRPDAEMEGWLSSNICCCTSYQEIRESVKNVLQHEKQGDA